MDIAQIEHDMLIAKATTSPALQRALWAAALHGDLVAQNALMMPKEAFGSEMLATWIAEQEEKRSPVSRLLRRTRSPAYWIEDCKRVHTAVFRVIEAPGRSWLERLRPALGRFHAPPRQEAIIRSWLRTSPEWATALRVQHLLDRGDDMSSFPVLAEDTVRRDVLSDLAKLYAAHEIGAHRRALVSAIAWSLILLGLGLRTLFYVDVVQTWLALFGILGVVTLPIALALRALNRVTDLPTATWRLRTLVVLGFSTETFPFLPSSVTPPDAAPSA